MNNLYESIKNKNEKIAIIGLGYVGLPLTVSFSEHVDIIGFDINQEKIKLYKNGIDPTNEIGNERLKKAKIFFSSDEKDLEKAKFFIVAVPTPVTNDKKPDLNPVIGASKIVGRTMPKGSIVVYESTVYPGVTEEVCVPILEKESGLKYGIDFKVGYSPERINPGDKQHTVDSITKVVSGMDQESLDIISDIYSIVVKAGVYRAKSIKVAEAAKVIENTQRDINIAFMNELSIIFNKLGIDTQAVLEAAGTKWNFLKFTPGLVGGHCIGVDPYYLTYKAETIGYHPQVILSGRRINDSMGIYIAENTVKQLIKADRQIKGSRVLIMGFTFKENVPDVRNTRVIDILNELREYNIEVLVSDEIADKHETLKEYGINLVSLKEVGKIDAIIFAVAHEIYKNTNLEHLKNYFINCKPVIIDVKGLFKEKNAVDLGYYYWRL